jgi:pimeloyl-ACP methyl ester carboxylesterase
MAPKEPPAVERRRVRCGRASIYYEVTGSGDPLVLVHGLSGSGRWWRRNLAALAGERRVYAVDLVGFGGSRGGLRVPLREAARYLGRWMEALGLAEAAVVGHSMGGFVAADLAAEEPDRVSKLVLVAAAAAPFRYSYRGHLGSVRHNALRLPLSFLPVLLADSLRAGPLTILRAGRELLASDIRVKLGTIVAPTLIIWGERDRLVPPEVGEQLRSVVPNAELATIRGAGHLPMWERPAEFNRLVLEFLRR